MSETTFAQIKVLPEDMQLRYLHMVCQYGLYGIEPELSGIELALWIPMRDLIRNSKCNDETWHKKQRENGKKGGAPEGNQNAKKTTQINPNQPVVFETTSCFETTPNDNDNDNDNVNLNANAKKKGIQEAQSDQAVESPAETDLEETLFFTEAPVLEKLSEEPQAPETHIVATTVHRPVISPSATGQPAAFSARASPQGDFMSWYETTRKAWNLLFPGMPALTLATNLKDFKMKDHILTFQNFPDVKQNNRAMLNYIKISSDPDHYKQGGCVYQSFEGFLANGLDKYIDEAKPFDRFLDPEIRQALAERQAHQDEREKSIARIREAKKQQGEMSA
ncbi:MAG: DUF6291 domain-containing protein [Treponema sp.]|nr:DUF6291 domain-containing protein [Treponema sp.]